MTSLSSPLEVPPVRDALDAAADPVLARSVLERLLAAHPWLAETLVDEPLVRDALIAIACASRSLTSGVIADPRALDVLRDPVGFGAEREAEAYHALAVQALAADDDGVRALRRWKRTELLRVAARDLLGVAPLPVVGRELAALADACLSRALALARPEIPISVIGMGKLGGRELNYASDVDILVVHDGDGHEADRVVRSVLVTMTTPTADGIVFRTDADLRPEGRAGPLSRTLASYESWYERWARSWEFQALIKARPVAGDAELGAAFLDLTRQFVWPHHLDPDVIREVRAMKARAEDELARRGLREREVKRGRGGIRDIEFAVQLLQLVHGRLDERIRSPNTIVALAQLVEGGYVSAADGESLRASYTFLRHVEHRLQLWDEQQTHTLPADVPARTRLARVMGYRDRPDATAVEAFDADYRSRQATVRAIHERLFFAPLLDTLAGVGPMSVDAAEERLTAFGFVDAAHTRAALRELTHGLTRTSRVMHQLLPVVLDWLSSTPDPDLGLLQLRRLAEGPTRAAALAATFRESPGAAERVCRILGSSRQLGDALLHQPEVVDALADDAEVVREHTRAELVEAALETLQWRVDDAQRRAGLRRFKRREFLRIAARDVLGLAPVEVTGRELAALADACVEAALRALNPRIAFAVIGLGRLGGRELSYSSDIDVLFVYDGDRPSDFTMAERIATQLVAELGATTAEGQTFRVDANLRPEGRLGALARSLASYRSYYADYGLVWEFQALLRARVVAGDEELGARFLAMVEPFVYRDPFPEEAAREVRRVKVRVEQERIPPGEDPQFHLKLGRGALTDVEFTVQLMQLLHGALRPEIRTPSTIDALHRLRHAGLLLAEDADALEESYRFCERTRNARYLVVGTPGDALPSGPEAARVARLLGYVHRPQSELRDDFLRLTRRARRVVERVFYGR